MCASTRYLPTDSRKTCNGLSFSFVSLSSVENSKSLSNWFIRKTRTFVPSTRKSYFVAQPGCPISRSRFPHIVTREEGDERLVVFAPSVGCLAVRELCVESPRPVMKSHPNKQFCPR